jgi:hypothetical protein
LGSKLLRELPEVVTSPQEAVYAFEDGRQADSFQRFCQARELEIRRCHLSELGTWWLEHDRYGDSFLVPEFSFNPAILAGRFAQTCLDQGGTVLTHQRAVEYEHRRGHSEVILENGHILTADFVVNAMARWCCNLTVPADAPQVDIRWFRWRLLCLNRLALPSSAGLDRVLVVMRKGSVAPSAIPHQGWISLDHNETQVSETDNPDASPHDWRKFDRSCRADRANFEAVSAVFPPIAAIGDEALAKHLFSLAGVQGRISGARPGSVNQVLTSAAVPGYFLCFGGQASTSVLDALEVVERVVEAGGLEVGSRQQWLGLLRSNLTCHSIADSSQMVWQRVE